VVKFYTLALFAPVALCLPAAAQWLNYPTPGIPRTADGKPNLSAPAPHIADGNRTFPASGVNRNPPRARPTRPCGPSKPSPGPRK
jgi:hypothetical protein